MLVESLVARADVVVHAANPPYTRWQRESMILAQGAAEAQDPQGTQDNEGRSWNLGAACASK